MKTTQDNHNQEVQMTAVVLNWRRDDNVRKIANYLIKYPFITEVIIWNNSSQEFNLGFKNENIKVINSKENLRDKAKYLAAAEAKNDYVFYQDDDWNVQHYLKAMHYAFCLNPEFIHTIVGELSWIMHKAETRKCINTGKNLQAEFSFIGAGTMFAKSFAVQHLKYIDEYYDEEQSGYADVGFTLFTNQPYIEIQVSLSHSGLDHDDDVAFSNETDFDSGIYKAITASRKALRHFSNKKKPLPELSIKSVFQNLLLFTNFYPHNLPKNTFLFEPTSEKHCQPTSKEEHNILRVEEFIREFRHNPYFSALLGTYQQRAPEQGWRTSLLKGHQFVLQSLIPADLILEVHFSSSEKDKMVVVSIDGEKHNYSVSQLNGMSLHFKNKVHFTAIENINDIRLVFNSANKQ